MHDNKQNNVHTCRLMKMNTSWTVQCRQTAHATNATTGMRSMSAFGGGEQGSSYKGGDYKESHNKMTEAMRQQQQNNWGQVWGLCWRGWGQRWKGQRAAANKAMI